jgi:hypothetical protein
MFYSDYEAQESGIVTEEAYDDVLTFVEEHHRRMGIEIPDTETESLL